MTDREMLELAAKAAGYTLDNDTSTYGFTLGGFKWNPLTDDGDALRLAVKLGMDIRHGEPTTSASRRSAVSAKAKGAALGFLQSYDGDPNAATRLAISRAAAEIGRSMK